MHIVSAIIASWIGRIGLLLVLAGACVYAYGKFSELPARSALQTVEGTVSEAKQITRTRTRRGQSTGSTSIDFQITITRAAGLPVELTMPSQEITRDQVVSIINRPVRAEYDGDRDVYALSSGGRTIISYEDTVKKRSGALASIATFGTALFGLGLPLVLLGWPLGARKLRKRAAAMQAAAAPAPMAT
jgi:hypothetical protein